MKTISTENLVDIIVGEPKQMFEARLLINVMYTATHFIYRSSPIALTDEGIDGEKRKVLATQFTREYQEKYWIVDNIVGMTAS